MKIEHTPGPWEAREHSDGSHWFVDWEQGGEGYTLVDGLSEADARLIAAAPDLLAALRKADALLKNASDTGLLDLLAGYMHPDEINGACDAVIAAIAKATGEPVA